MYILGCVNKPGTYEVPRNITVGKLADKAGGFTESADLERVNLVYRIKDNMMIVIKDKKDREKVSVVCPKCLVQEEKSDKKKDVEKKEKFKSKTYEICDDTTKEQKRKQTVRKKRQVDIGSDAEKKEDKKKDVSKSKSKDKVKTQKDEEAAKHKDDRTCDDVVNLENNKALAKDDKDKQDVLLPDNKKKSVDGKENEAGMEVIKGLYIDDPKDKVSSVVNINTATKDELMTLRGVGESMAEKIIEYRENNGDFDKIEELKLISGMGESKFNMIKDFVVV